MSIRKLDDGRYEWRHRVGGKHLKKVFLTRKQAVDHDSKVRADLARGVHVDLSSRVTVAEFARSWIDGRVMRSSSRRGRETFLCHHLEGTPLGARPLVRVRPSEVQAWITGRSAVIGPVTLHAYVGLLRGVFAAAVLDGVIARNPVQLQGRLSLPKQDKAKLVPLTIAQAAAWAGCAEPQIRAMILTQAGLGLRISELLALRVADVDFLRREVRIDEQLDQLGRRAPLKTSNSRRVVPLPSVTSEALAEHIRQHPPGPAGLIFTQAPKELRSNGRRNSSASTIRPDGSYPQKTATELYRAAARKAGLPDSITSHDLRHHYASVLLAAGESVHAVAERLGDTPAMVLDVYGHVMPDREDTTRKAVDAAWKQARQDGAEGAR